MKTSVNKDKPVIEAGKGLWGGRLLIFKELESTNDWARTNLRTLRSGDVVQAMVQTKGKGRQSRRWISGQEGGLTLSLIIRSGVKPEKAPLMGQAAALAVRETLLDFKIDSNVKWPNDVMVDDKKIAGILCEADFKAGRVIIGIGLNVNVTKTNMQALGQSPGAVSMQMAVSCEFPLHEVRSGLIRHCGLFIHQLEHRGSAWLMKRWMSADWLQGSTIEVEGVTGAVRGRYNGVDSEGRLLLIDETGVQVVFFAGDVKKVVNEF